jgi:hypothetical protein
MVQLAPSLGIRRLYAICHADHRPSTTRMTTQPEQRAVHLSAIIERKQPDLPRFVVIPSCALAAWRLAGTTAVEISINGTAMARRTIKEWDRDRWFISITATDCRRLGVDTGDRVTIALRLAPAGLPGELARLLKADRRAKAAWRRLTASQQRMLGENIRAAKQPETRARRARKALLETI